MIRPIVEHSTKEINISSLDRLWIHHIITHKRYSIPNFIGNLVRCSSNYICEILYDEK